MQGSVVGWQYLSFTLAGYNIGLWVELRLAKIWNMIDNNGLKKTGSKENLFPYIFVYILVELKTIQKIVENMQVNLDEDEK